MASDSHRHTHHGSKVPDASDPAALLKEAALKVTPTRTAVLGLLLREDGPFSAQDIFSRLTRESCDLVTIYRCLEAFEKAELVKRCDFSDGIVRYEMNNPDHHHHHLICTECQSVEQIELDACPMEKFERTARTRGYSSIRHSVELFGICPKCQD